MLSALGAMLFLVLFTLSPLGWQALGHAWLTVVAAFCVIPLLDAWVGRAALPVFSGTPPWFARWVPRVQLPAQLALLLGAAAWAPALDAGQIVALTVAVGIVTGGSGITVAHELTHRRGALDRALAKGLLVTVGYCHFFVEHVRGHHVRVATPEDPATAPRGMNVYRFVARSVVGGARHAWRLEAMRLRQRGRSVWHPSNVVLTGALASLGLLALASWGFGPAAVVLLVGQAAVAVALLEVINYVEHYGLLRRRLGAHYEPVQPRHSWNADQRISNWILLNLQLHSDHHAHMDRPFETLRNWTDAPRLPAGYPTMVLLALLPPLWFRVMDPRLPTFPDAELPEQVVAG